VNTAKSFTELGLESEMVICSFGLPVAPPEMVKMSSVFLVSDGITDAVFKVSDAWSS